MDTYLGNAHRPRTVTDAQLQVLVMRLHVLFHHAVLHYQVERVEYVCRQSFLLKVLQQRSDVFLTEIILILLDLALCSLEVVLGPSSRSVSTFGVKFVVPHFEHLSAPDQNEARLFFDRVTRALRLKLLDVLEFLVVLLACLNELSHLSVADFQVLL